MRFFLLLSGLILSLSAVYRPADAATDLIFGVYAADKPSAVVRQFRPVLDILEREISRTLGEPTRIRITVAKTYAEGIAKLVDGQVDFSRFGPASYVQAKQQEPGISILAMESKKGKKTYLGLICVHRDSPIRAVSDLKGTTFAFGSERSTIGRYLSQLYLSEHGISASDLDGYEYLGRHDSVGTAVAARKFAAGALKESTFKKLVSKGLPLRELASFPNVTKPWLARADLPQRLADALREALLAIKDKAALKALGKDGFVTGNDSDYDRIRKAIRNNRFFYD